MNLELAKLLKAGRLAQKKKAGYEAVGAFRKALDHKTAKRRGLFTVEVDYSGDCMNPPMMSSHHRGIVGGPGASRLPNTVIKTVRCRKCEACLKSDARRWAMRAIKEAAMATPGRTWSVTLTGSAEFHLRHMLAMRTDEMTDDMAFQALVLSEGNELKKSFKRMREHFQVNVRRLFVCEPHISNLPHWHGLIHEPAEGAITKRMLSGDPDIGKLSWFWPHGFVHARLCEPANIERAVWYCCEYLKKSHAQTRTRASSGYGVYDL